MKIAFYNAYHNGDIHVSRQFVKYVIEHVPAESYTYFHRNSERLLLDIPELTARPFGECQGFDGNSRSQNVDGTIVLNTWYVVSPVFPQNSCNLNSLYHLFKDHFAQHFTYQLTEPSQYFIPTIDFHYYSTDSCRRYLDSCVDYRLKVLVCNDDPKSGQSNVSGAKLTEAVRAVAAKHSDVLFLFTKKQALQESRQPLFNVCYTPDIIGLPAYVTNLNENAYVSTRCDVVIGLASGAYTFSYIQDNLLNPDKTMVCFTTEERIGRWVDKIKANIISSPCFEAKEVEALIDNVIAEKLRSKVSRVLL